MNFQLLALTGKYVAMLVVLLVIVAVQVAAIVFLICSRPAGKSRKSNTQPTNKIRLYYGIFLTLLTVAVGVAFIVAVAQVYYGGIEQNPDYPFELDRIRQYILVPFILLTCWIAAIIGGIVVSVIAPYNKKSKFVDNGNTLELIKKRVPTSGNEAFEQAKKQYSKQETARKCVWGVVLAICLAAAIAIFVYAFNIANYHADNLHGDILNLVKNVLSWTIAATICGVAGVIVDEVLLKRQIAAAKAMIVSGDRSTVKLKEVKRKTIIVSSVVACLVVVLAVVAYILAPIVIRATLNTKQTAVYAVVFVVATIVAASFAGYSVVKNHVPDKVNKWLVLCARIAIGVVAVVFIVVGAINGGAYDVFVKAINICTECIGLG